MKNCVFTIVSLNYLSFAKTLLDSLSVSNPDMDQYILIVDKLEGKLDIHERVNVVQLHEIDLPDMQKMLFRYTILEINTAVKPWMLEYLHKMNKYDSITYFDPDIYVFEPITESLQAIDNGFDIVLTPHLTGMLNDDKRPAEVDIMRAGTYNLGYTTISGRKESLKIVKWWQEKLEYLCVVDMTQGLFVDQKWMDLVPGIFNNVFILRHEGYNVAYWNVNHRKVVKHDDKYFVNNMKLVFFHYSGFNPNDYSGFSKHQNRFSLSDVGDVKHLMDAYGQHVLNHQHNNNKNIKYFYNYFEDGVMIPDYVRYFYRNSESLINHLGENPFADSKKVVNYCSNGSERKKRLPITDFMKYTWDTLELVKNAFPNPYYGDRESFYMWFATNAAQEYRIDEKLLLPIKERFDHVNGNPTLTLKAKRFVKRVVFKIFRIFKAIAKKFITGDLRQLVKDKAKRVETKLTRTKYSLADNTDVHQFNVQAYSEGVNIVGYLSAEMGIGESVRNSVKALDNIPSIKTSLVNFSIGNQARMADSSYTTRESNEFLHDINLIHVNADQTPVLKANIDSDHFANKYNIGYWWWELEDFPDDWYEAFKFYDEIWVGSDFVRNSISKKSPVPVIKVPLCIELSYNTNFDREYFGFPKDKFLFFTMYDVFSFQQRKNPKAVIESYLNAFPQEGNTCLVIKVNNGHRAVEELAALKALVANRSDVIIINKTLDRIEINSLIRVIDCAVSLHRSEGLGLLMAESMYFGKPVIATNWSGNTDFINEMNSCPVNYTLIDVGADYGPYKAYQRWADPDVKHATEYMKKLVDDKDYYNNLSKNAEKTIQEMYSSQEIGRIMKERFDYIRKGTPYARKITGDRHHGGEQ